MRYKLFGKSGLRVAELALGTMTFGQDWGFGADKEGSRQMFDTYVEAGGNFIDTAINYNDGTSENYVGEFVAPNRDRFVIATKYSMWGKGDVNLSGNQRKNMMRSLSESLKRMKTDYVDLYWVHAPDFVTPVEEVMRALDDMVRMGMVLYLGISDAPSWWTAQANTMSDLRGWTRFVGLQTRYSLVERSAERELLPMARAMDMAFTPFQVLALGLLTGKYSQSPDATGRGATSDLRANERVAAIVAELINVARETGATPAQVATSWVRQQPGVIIPIVGARNVEQLKDSLGCLDVTLSPEQMQRLSEVSRIELGFPHEFLASDSIKRQLFAGMYSEIDRHRGETW